MFFMSNSTYCCLLLFSCLLLSSNKTSRNEKEFETNFRASTTKKILIGSSSCFKASPLSKHIAEKDSAILLSISVVANLSRAHNLTKTAYIIKKIYTKQYQQSKRRGLEIHIRRSKDKWTLINTTHTSHLQLLSANGMFYELTA